MWRVAAHVIIFVLTAAEVDRASALADATAAVAVAASQLVIVVRANAAVAAVVAAAVRLNNCVCMLLCLVVVLRRILISRERVSKREGVLEQLSKRERFACFGNVVRNVLVLRPHTNSGMYREIVIMLHTKVNHKRVKIGIDKDVIPSSGYLGICRKASGLIVWLPPTMSLSTKVLPPMIFNENHQLCNIFGVGV